MFVVLFTAGKYAFSIACIENYIKQIVTEQWFSEET